MITYTPVKWTKEPGKDICNIAIYESTLIFLVQIVSFYKLSLKTFGV